MSRTSRRTATMIAVGFATLLLAATAAAQEELVSDRPDFAPSTQVVMLHRVIFEGGFSATVNRDRRTLSGPEFLIRYGLLSRLELRLGLPDYERTSSRSGVHGRLAETYVGAKVQLLPADHRYGVALLPGFTTPADEHERGGAAPELTLAVSSPALLGFGVRGSLAREWREGAQRGSDRIVSTVSAGRRLGLGISSFAGAVAEFQDDGQKALTFHHGYTLELYPDGQVDVHLGLGVTEAAPDYFLGVGVAVRH